MKRKSTDTVIIAVKERPVRARQNIDDDEWDESEFVDSVSAGKYAHVKGADRRVGPEIESENKRPRGENGQGIYIGD